MEAIHRCPPLSGFCYTQLTDTFLEKNGLLTEHRVPKAPIEALAKATRGPDAMLHDWWVDPLGHGEKWRIRRGDLPADWIRVSERAEVLAYPGAVPPDAPGEGEPPGVERRGRGVGARTRRKAA
jgi:hypothetical protein